jgi:hypothetical protein
MFDKINKEKLKLKIYEEFTSCAKEGAIGIIEGLIPPVNPY